MAGTSAPGHIDDLQQGNRYAYAGGDPVNSLDLNGLSAQSDLSWLGVGLGVAVGFAVALPWLAPSGQGSAS